MNQTNRIWPTSELDFSDFFEKFAKKRSNISFSPMLTMVVIHAPPSPSTQRHPFPPDETILKAAAWVEKIGDILVEQQGVGNPQIKWRHQNHPDADQGKEGNCRGGQFKPADDGDNATISKIVSFMTCQDWPRPVERLSMNSLAQRIFDGLSAQAFQFKPTPGIFSLAKCESSLRHHATLKLSTS